MLRTDKKKPPSLESLCVINLAKGFEEFLKGLSCRTTLPPHIKLAMVAIARRKSLIDDMVIIKLVDKSWDILDLSGSEVSDIGLWAVSSICKNIRAIDISHCSNITPFGISLLTGYCHLLEILRWGGGPTSERIARGSIIFLKPELIEADVDSWEEADSTALVGGPQSLDCLVWPKVDKDSYESLAKECPRVRVNPKPLLLSPWVKVPEHALPGVALDASVLDDINPKTWEAPQINVKKIELPTAEDTYIISAPMRPGRQQPPPKDALSGKEVGKLILQHVYQKKFPITGCKLEAASPFASPKILESYLEERVM